MKINIQADGITLTPDIYSYLDKKLQNIEKILESDSTAAAHVEVGKSTNHHRTGSFYEAKMVLRASGQDFAAVGTGESVYAAIDMLKDEISRELTAHKDKKLTLIKKGGRAIKEMARRVWPF